MSETPTNSTTMTREEEEEEVRTLLERHQERIRLDLANTELLAVLVKNSVLTQSEEDLLLKPHNAAAQPGSAPSSVGVTKRKLSAVISNASGTSSSAGSTTTSNSLANNNNTNNGSVTNSRSGSVVGDDNTQSGDNRSITPSVVVNNHHHHHHLLLQENSDNLSDLYSTTKDDELNHQHQQHILNDADIIRLQCANLIEIIAKNGFEKFKQFCYAIENECPQLIEDLINDRLKCDGTFDEEKNEDKLQKEIDTIEYIDKDKENDRNRRAVSYGGITNSTSMTTLPRAAPRRVNLMKDPPPPPPPKPILLQQTSVQSSTTSNTSSLSIPSKYPQSEYNLITKLESTTTSSLTAPSQYQAQNFYANASTIAAASSNNYSSLLCHASSTSSPLAVRKREKLLHRFSDAATLGRKLKKKKNTNRTCRSMTEAIEMLADPVIEDEFFCFFSVH